MHLRFGYIKNGIGIHFKNFNENIDIDSIYEINESAYLLNSISK